LVRGWHINFENKEERQQVIDEFLKQGTGIQVGDIIDNLHTNIEEQWSYKELQGFIDVYKQVPSGDSTITLTEPNHNETEFGYGIMQLASGTGDQRKIKNVVRHLILCKLMLIADELEIKYTVYSG
jgi:hypothetical protein